MENLDTFKLLFFIKPLKGDILTTIVFPLKVSHTLLNYAFLLFWSILGEIHRELFFLVQKSDYLREEHWNIQNFVFPYHVWKGANPEENLDLFKQLFFIKPVKGDILTKIVFLHKVSHILLNSAFLLFWSILGEIHRELFFLVKKKWLYQKGALKNSESLFFLPCLKRGKSSEKFGFV